MLTLHTLARPMDDWTLETLQRDPRQPLSALQGNILRGHGRFYAAHLLLHFHPGRHAAVTQWLRTLAVQLTTAQQQLEETRQSRGLFRAFFLSAHGYAYLDSAFPRRNPGLHDTAFRAGMKAARHRLNDPLPQTWEPGYQQDIHAMLLLAADDPVALHHDTDLWCASLQPHTTVCAIEHGQAMLNAHGDRVEHFGYADGLSQPLFFQSDLARLKRHGERLDIWNPGAGPQIALVPDPYARQEGACGSYFVFRKLEQRVRAFKAMEQRLARVLQLTGEAAERAGALVVGRFEDGTPIVLQDTDGRRTNSFTYADDPDGQRCPWQAHIRKINPRQPGIPVIVRRGITYGTRSAESHEAASLSTLPTDGVGLLFMCYQRAIAPQFEFLQAALANNPAFPIKQAPGIDPLIGQPGSQGVGWHRWPNAAGHLQQRPVNFYDFVRLKGGEYFFTPSLPSLHQMG